MHAIAMGDGVSALRVSVRRDMDAIPPDLHQAIRHLEKAEWNNASV